MKTYVITAPMGANFAGGRLALTPEQYEARAHKLRAVPDEEGVYEIIGSVTFKKDEVVGFDGPVNKVLVEEITEVEESEHEHGQALTDAGIRKMKAEDLKKELDARGIEYDPKAKKADLADLLSKAMKEKTEGEG